MDFSPESGPSSRPGWIIGAAALAALLLLLGRNALVSSEGDLAECVREILQGREVFPCGGVWVPDAPGDLFLGRLTALLAGVLGNTEWTLRLPSVLAALLTLGGTMKLTAAFFDRKTAFAAGWLTIGSYGFLFWGRHASWHMMPAATTVWCAVLLVRSEKRFASAAALGVLALTGMLWWGWFFLLPLLALTPLFRQGGFVRAGKWYWCGAGLTAALAALAGFGLLICSFAPGIGEIPRYALEMEYEVWHTSRVLMLWPGAGNLSWYGALENLPRLLLPWVPLTAVALAGMIVRRRELSPDVRRLLWTAGLLMALTGIFPGRRWQYQLPMLPVFLVLTAGGVTGECGVERWNFRVGQGMEILFSLLGSLAAAVAVTYPVWDMLLKVSPPLSIMVGVPLLGLLAVVLLIFDTGPTCAVERSSGMRGAWSGYILAGTVLSVALWSVTVPSLTKFRSGRPFWRKCGAIVRTFPPENIILAGNPPNASELYYLDLPGEATAVAEPEPFRRCLNSCIKGGQAVVILRRRDAEKFIRATLGTRWGWREKPEIREGVPLRLVGKADKEEKRYELYCLDLLKYGGKQHAK